MSKPLPQLPISPSRRQSVLRKNTIMKMNEGLHVKDESEKELGRKRNASIMEDIKSKTFESDVLKEFVFSLKEGSVSRLKLLFTTSNASQLKGPHLCLENRNCLHLAIQYGFKHKGSNDLDFSNGSFVFEKMKELKFLDEFLKLKDSNGLSMFYSLFINDNMITAPFHYMVCHTNLYDCINILYDSYISEYFVANAIEKADNFDAWIVAKEFKETILNCVIKCAINSNLDYLKLLNMLGVDILQPLSEHEVSILVSLISVTNIKTSLHLAVRHGSSVLVNYLLQKGAYIDACFFSTHYQNWTPLCEAVMNKQKEMILFLINKNADMNRKFKHKKFGKVNMNVIALASYLGDLEMVSFFQSKGINIQKSFCVYWAAAGGQIELLKVLLNPPFTLNIDEKNVDNKNRQPLHVAVENMRESVVYFIVKMFPEFVNSVDKEGNSALHIAVLPATTDEELDFKKKITTALLDAGANIQLKNAQGKTPIDLAKDEDIIHSIERKHLDQTINVENSTAVNSEIIKILNKKVENLEETIQRQDQLIEFCLERIQALEQKLENKH
ncbi:predicted protein [Naegleria gruberi]|uniref:Predicted protein n=1 Tax=Naegleria gruberi TaxID=5762 RepID=D2VGU8_NAEGR|nr:uncharacterized protein NAEGRDRAFT_68103 [Naegleria gruberi]EFC44124.1 predicted protein [Naegleria gruberi]|eukprot:XP_002676868.1 predicted protein [Naegleria gruberi strain NEG-M]